MFATPRRTWPARHTQTRAPDLTSGHVTSERECGLFLCATAFLCRPCNQKVFFFLAGLDFPRQPSGGAAPAAPRLAGLWVPVFRRYFGTLYRTGPPRGNAVAAD